MMPPRLACPEGRLHVCLWAISRQELLSEFEVQQERVSPGSSSTLDWAVIILVN